MMRIRFQLVALAALLLPSVALGQASRTGSEAAVLHPGDVIAITVWRQPELTGEFQIAADGTVRHPVYREIRVADVPFAQVEQRVRELLQRYQSDPQFVIEPRVRVAVGGEVRTPGLYTVAPEVTIAQALALAGGPSERGRGDRVTVYRRGQVLLLPLTDNVAGAAEMTVQSADQIVVERHRELMRDVIAPAASVTGLAASLISLVFFLLTR
jgi:protein involved in polysaccharide export with SLBB domain